MSKIIFQCQADRRNGFVREIRAGQALEVHVTGPLDATGKHALEYSAVFDNDDRQEAIDTCQRVTIDGRL